MAKGELTPKQQRFVQEYLVDSNGTQAAIRAGYSANTARTQAAENLAKPNIQAAVRAGREKQQKRTEVTADRIVKELEKLGFDGIRDGVTIKSLELLGKHLRMFEGEGAGVNVNIIFDGARETIAGKLAQLQSRREE